MDQQLSVNTGLDLPHKLCCPELECSHSSWARLPLAKRPGKKLRPGKVPPPGRPQLPPAAPDMATGRKG